MSRVRVLPAEIVAKIAAGEVIERPASVVKELLENSLDAGAASIQIELKNAGKTFLRVKDSGSGIDAEDIDTLFSRHATSKLDTVEGLYRINSLGFRGEALYSIAAVSDVILRSRTKDQDSGWETHVRANEKIGKKPVPMGVGTDIEINELFFNTPARRKFMKSNTSELNAILDIIIPYTLLYPQVKFTVTHNAKPLLELPAQKDQLGRIAQSLNLERKFIIEGRRDFSERNLSLRLILGDINLQRSRKDMQFIFVNNRPVHNRTISFHMNEIYRMLFEPGVYPFFCCFVELPAQDVDVNVHPSKREVKLRDDLALIQALRPFCEHLLMTNSQARQAQERIFQPGYQPKEAVAEPRAETAFFVTAGQQQDLSLEENILLFKTGDLGLQKKSGLKERLKQARYLGNLLKKYLLFETPDSLLVIDQHAAQERITFEKLWLQLEKGKVEVQNLLAPVLIKLSPQELLAWEEAGDHLASFGFANSLFDKETLAIHSQPELVTDTESAVRNLLAGEAIAKADIETIARRACRSSVMTGFAMNPEQAEYQRAELLCCKDPFTCPHGRPTVVEISEPQLSKQFLRPS